MTTSIVADSPVRAWRAGTRHLLATLVSLLAAPWAIVLLVIVAA